MKKIARSKDLYIVLMDDNRNLLVDVKNNITWIDGNRVTEFFELRWMRGDAVQYILSLAHSEVEKETRGYLDRAISLGATPEMIDAICCYLVGWYQESPEGLQRPYWAYLVRAIRNNDVEAIRRASSLTAYAKGQWLLDRMVQRFGEEIREDFKLVMGEEARIEVLINPQAQTAAIRAWRKACADRTAMADVKAFAEAKGVVRFFEDADFEINVPLSVDTAVYNYGKLAEYQVEYGINFDPKGDLEKELERVRKIVELKRHEERESIFRSNQRNAYSWLSFEDDNYRVVVPTTYSELVDIGDEFHNCSAGYEFDTYLESGDRYLVVARHVTGNHMLDLCIDIDAEDGEICQCLGYFNEPVEDTDAEAFHDAYQKHLWK